MKKILYIATALLSVAIISGCDNFLDTQSLTKKDTSNFPINETDAEQMIAGIYTIMNNNIDDPECDPFFVFEMAGDDRLGGGSQSNIGAQSCDRLMNDITDKFKPFWKARYAGIFRANNAIETMDNVQVWSSESKKNQLLGEAYFLRAFYYFNFAQIFQNVPLVLTTEAVNLPKAGTDEIYARIASDLKTAITIMPSDRYPANEGHATKWAAEGMMARVWLFYTGFYGKQTLPLADGGSVSKSEVAAWLEDCIKNSGFKLVSDQRNLWPYTNPFTAKDYPYAVENGLVWETDENPESMFAVKMSNIGSFAAGMQRHNRIVEYFGIRSSTADAFPFTPQGYSNGPVCTALWEDWAEDPDYEGDYRRVGSICKREIEIPDYPGDIKKEVENTDLLAKKYLGCGAYGDDGILYLSYGYFYGSENNRQTGLTQSLVWLRFADVLLMHSELTDGAVVYNGKSGLNAVRERAGLGDVSYSLDALKKERRYELCFEAVRWNDLRRWGDVAEIVKNQEGNPIKNEKNTGVYEFQSNHQFMDRYKATGGGFFKIPESQVVLSEGVLEQNPGWEAAESNFAKGDLPYFKK